MSEMKIVVPEGMIEAGEQAAMGIYRGAKPILEAATNGWLLREEKNGDPAEHKHLLIPILRPCGDVVRSLVITPCQPAFTHCSAAHLFPPIALTRCFVPTDASVGDSIR